MKAITFQKAIKIAKEQGVSLTHDDGVTYYASNEKETEVYEFDSKKERDKLCRACDTAKHE